MKKAVIDIETTGFGKEDRITEIAIIKFDGDEIISEYQSLVNPGIPIPKVVIEKTGITNEMVSTAPVFADIVDELIPHLEFSRVLIAHNAPFDKRFLVRELAACKISLSAQWECTLKQARKLWPTRTSHSLGDLIKDLNITNDAAHRAMGDAKATLELYQKFGGLQS